MRLATFCLLAAAAGCANQVVPELKGGDGVEVDSADHTINLNPDMVPLLAECVAGELIMRTASGWECVFPTGLPVYTAGDGLLIENDHIAVQFGTNSWQAAPGNHDHDDRYRMKDDFLGWSELDPTTIPDFMYKGDVTQYTDDDARDAVGWGTVRTTVGAGDVWPGIISAMQVTDLPVASWQSIAPTVDPWTLWPGQINYSQIANAPETKWSDISPSIAPTTTWPGSVTWESMKNNVTSTSIWPGTVPYSRVTGVPAVLWSSISSSVTATTDWPGTVPYSRVSGAPSVTWDTVRQNIYSSTEWPGSVNYTSLIGAPPVTWSTVSTGVTSGTDWPGTVPYSRVSGAPAVNWTSINASVTSSTPWPGTVAYSSVTGAPTLNWDAVKTSVTGTTDWPGTVSYSRVSGAPALTWSTVASSVTSTTDWLGTVPYTRVTGAPPVTWDTVRANVTSTTDWPGQMSWNNVKDVTSGTEWPGTIQYSRVAGAPDVSLGTVYQYTTAASLPASPAEGTRAYLQSNLCLYQYNSSYSRWEVVNCDYYPDWSVNSGSNLNFVDQNGNTQLVAFPLLDSAATRDFLYGLTYNSTTGYYLEIGSLTSDDGAAPSKIRGRWQRCGYTVSSRSICLPYLGMLRDTVGNVFESDWMRSGTRTFTGGRTIVTPAADTSLVTLSSPATTAYFTSYGYSVAPYGSSVYCGTATCVTPQYPGRTRGVRVSSFNATLTLLWYDESR